jgi:hypothetical protein
MWGAVEMISGNCCLFIKFHLFPFVTWIVVDSCCLKYNGESSENLSLCVMQCNVANQSYSFVCLLYTSAYSEHSVHLVPSVHKCDQWTQCPLGAFCTQVRPVNRVSTWCLLYTSVYSEHSVHLVPTVHKCVQWTQCPLACFVSGTTWILGGFHTISWHTDLILVTIGWV